MKCCDSNVVAQPHVPPLAVTRLLIIDASTVFSVDYTVTNAPFITTEIFHYIGCR
jgi:hypothetical protein